MNKNEPKSLGDNEIIKYQKVLIFTGLTLIIFFSLISLAYKSFDFLLGTGIITLVFLIFFLFYLKIFSVKYDKDFFYVKNILYNHKLDASKFRHIKNVRYLGFIYKMEFEHGSFYFMLKSDVFFKNVFRKRAEIAKKLELEIKSDRTM
jgi:hypothetical protein